MENDSQFRDEVLAGDQWLIPFQALYGTPENLLTEMKARCDRWGFHEERRVFTIAFVKLTDWRQNAVDSDGPQQMPKTRDMSSTIIRDSQESKTAFGTQPTRDTAAAFFRAARLGSAVHWFRYNNGYLVHWEEESILTLLEDIRLTGEDAVNMFDEGRCITTGEFFEFVIEQLHEKHRPGKGCGNYILEVHQGQSKELQVRRVQVVYSALVGESELTQEAIPDDIAVAVAEGLLQDEKTAKRIRAILKTMGTGDIESVAGQ